MVFEVVPLSYELLLLYVNCSSLVLLHRSRPVGEKRVSITQPIKFTRVEGRAGVLGPPSLPSCLSVVPYAYCRLFMSRDQSIVDAMAGTNSINSVSSVSSTLNSTHCIISQAAPSQPLFAAASSPCFRVLCCRVIQSSECVSAVAQATTPFFFSDFFTI